jgi:prevent-host-death family protein
MTQMTIAQAREHISELLNQVSYGKQRVVLTRRGKKIAAMVSVEDLDLLESGIGAGGAQEPGADYRAKKPSHPLLKHSGRWMGNDAKKLLRDVYRNRTKAEF